MKAGLSDGGRTDGSHAGAAVAARGTARGSSLLIFVAIALTLWVVAVNRAPLFYFDSMAYLERGETLLGMVGLAPDPAPAEPGAAPAPPADDRAPDGGVDGSRSPVYSLMVGVFAMTLGLEALLLAQAALAVAAVWLCARVVLREHQVKLTPAAVTLAAIASAALGSLPFFVGYVMPDIFAPVLLLMAALLTAYAGRMTWGELFIATLFGIAAVLVHLSHQAVAMLLVPLSLIVALLLRRPRPWLAPVLIAVMALSGMAERVAFRTAVQTVQQAEVVVLPFLTARLIEDHVGYEYLERNCPAEEVPTCHMWEALQQSDNPERLTATNITFARSEELGSYRLLDPEEQREVSRAQYDFFFDVLAEDFLGVTLALLSNTLIQAGTNGVNMTLPTEAVMNRSAGFDGFVFLDVEQGPLAANRDWIEPTTTAQQVLYGLAALALLVVVLLPRTPAPLRGFLLMVLLGVLVNAFVCGAVSQPASRYGARVIWILPAAVMIALAVLLGSRAARGASRT